MDIKKNITKYIYIKNDNSFGGFGNKVFNLIYGIYLYNLYNKNNNKCIINYVIGHSSHDKYNDKQIYEIFPNSKHKINYITDNQYQKLNENPSIKIHIIYSNDPQIKDLNTFPDYEDLHKYNNIYNNFRLIYEIYNKFSKIDKDIFYINKNIFNDKNITNTTNKSDTIDKIINKPYSLIHIRYGDKLYYLSKIINKPDIDIPSLLNKDSISNSNIDQFILYTPNYYIDKINELLKTTPISMNVYIISDSNNLVKEFIMKPTYNFNKNPRVVFLENLNWLSSFYLLYYASNIILSSSTFCFAGAYFNKKKAKCDLLLYHHNKHNPKIAPEEYAISPYWNILSDRKYILNYNPKIAYEILKYKYNWKY
jgi:hypothetical protein